jgi:hypothetical protein
MAAQSTALVIAQLILTPVLAAVTTLIVQRRQERERLSCFVDWRYSLDEDDFYEYPYIGLHNRSTQPIAVHPLGSKRNIC